MFNNFGVGEEDVIPKDYVAEDEGEEDRSLVVVTEEGLMDLPDVVQVADPLVDFVAQANNLEVFR